MNENLISPIFSEDSSWRRLPVIAGPCSAESEEQVMETASALADAGVRFFRAGVWKPRTRPGGFEGIGEKALSWLRKAAEEFGMRVGCEVGNSGHATMALDAGMDFVWVGARTTVNPFAVAEVAETIARLNPEITVLVKNPVNPDIELWIGALQRFLKAGVRRLGAVHRGFSGYGVSEMRNNPMWSVPIELHRRWPELPILCDPSHIAGKRELIDTLSQRALSIGFDGLIIESHCDPDSALSDATQQIKPAQLSVMMREWRYRQPENANGTGLEKFRSEIDQIDEELLALLARRMEISRRIGEYKRENDLSVVQIGRHNHVIRDRTQSGKDKGLNPSFVERMFRLIHEESVNQQT